MVCAATALSAPAVRAAPDPAPDPALVGHYYLSGVRETGSELRLKADGRFEWMLSYGAVDQVAEGQWERDGATITLRTALPDRTQPLFRTLDREDWSVEAEQLLRDRQAEAAATAAAQRCPFLGDTATAMSAPPVAVAMAPGTETPPPPVPTSLEVAAAVARAEGLRAVAEALARAAVDDGGTAGAERARAAFAEWDEARALAETQARTAGLDRPALPDPVLPAQCTSAPVAAAAALPPAQWTGGLAVRVVEPAYRQGIRGVDVTLELADGGRERLQTAGRGMVVRPGALPAPVVAVTLAFPPLPGRDQRIVVDPIARGVLYFAIDGRQLIAPPFDTLRLRIDGRALIPEGLIRGRYERGG